MGLFDRWFGAKKLDNPNALRDALFAAVASGDASSLAELCRQHEAAILEGFAQWRKVPAEVRADASLVPAYAQGLMSVASHMASTGHPELMAQLMPPAAANPITRYQGVIEQARMLIADLRFDAALEQLRELIAELEKVQGTAVDRYLPIARGFVSECQFNRGNAEAAIPPASLALADCERVGDVEGVVTYQRNLFEIHRYLAQAERAAHYAELLASSLESSGDVEQARWYRAHARVVRAGEPLNRVIAVIGDSRYELDSLPPKHEGRIQFVFQRNRMTLRPASSAMDQARLLGGEGKYLEALDELERAAKLDPFDPEPSYLAGLSMLHLKRYAEAVESYSRCEDLGPGWFHVRADRWFAERLAHGELDHATFLLHLELTDGSASPERKLQLVSQVLGAAGTLAPFHLHRGKACAALGRQPEAIQSFRDGLGQENDPGTRTRLLVELGSRLSGPERIEKLEAAISLDGDLVAAAMARVMLQHASQWN
jgi:tetratricopeptide (TPR) repeat protein